MTLYYVLVLCYTEKTNWKLRTGSMFSITHLLIYFPLKSKVAVRNSLFRSDFPLFVNSLNAPSNPEFFNSGPQDPLPSMFLILLCSNTPDHRITISFSSRSTQVSQWPIDLSQVCREKIPRTWTEGLNSGVTNVCSEWDKNSDYHFSFRSPPVIVALSRPVLAICVSRNKHLFLPHAGRLYNWNIAAEPVQWCHLITSLSLDSSPDFHSQ